MENKPLNMHAVHIRPIEWRDNMAIATIIRAALTEFGANKPGTVYYDPTTDDLYALFKQPGSIYFIAEFENTILGGAGIFPTENLPASMGELVKLYLSPSARGLGLGKKLLQSAMDWAKLNGYRSIYLESMPELSKAVSMYAHLGFKRINHPLGNTGHSGCDIWMVKELD